MRVAERRQQERDLRQRDQEELKELLLTLVRKHGLFEAIRIRANTVVFRGDWVAAAAQFKELGLMT